MEEPVLRGEARCCSPRPCHLLPGRRRVAPRVPATFSRGDAGQPHLASCRTEDTASVTVTTEQEDAEAVQLGTVILKSLQKRLDF